jgi:ABC-type polysaccharide/polyol phosphate export permease
MSNPLIFLADSLLVIMYSFVIFGFGMILASTINRNEMWFTIRGMAVGVIVFFSSAYYPTSVLPSPLSTIASYNPMTLSLDAFRSLQSGIFLEGDFAELGIWVIFVCVLAYKAYESRTRR